MKILKACAGIGLAGGLVVAFPAFAALDAVVDRDDQGYLIGASMASSSSHVGNAKVQFDLKPMWAFQVGRVRISRSRANALMSAGKERLETGLSAKFDLFSDWRLGTSLRLDNGRSFAQDPKLTGLPDVDTTLRGRLSLSRSFGPRWNVHASVDQDLLGREGGMRLSHGVGYRWPLTDQTALDFSLASTWGNHRYMQTQYGISRSGGALVGRDAFLLGSSWENARAGVQFSHSINTNWVAFGGMDFSHLLRRAAHSPLVGRVTTHSMSVGLAYRSR